MGNRDRLLLVLSMLFATVAAVAQEGPRIDRPAGARQPEHVSSYVGNVVIRTQGIRVYVMVDTTFDRATPSDGMVDQWFVLETETPLLTPLSEHLEDAVLFYSAGILQVNSVDRRFEFTLENDLRSTDVANTRIVGVGLSHNKAAKTAIRIAEESRKVRVSATCDACEALDPDPGAGGGGGTSCSSGGSGATQCSASQGSYSCSITCGANRYACCNYGSNGVPYCRCVSG